MAPRKTSSSTQLKVYRPRVLVVDDDAILLRAYDRALSSYADVQLCSRSSHALRLVERGAVFDLVLCDLSMPDIDGKGLYERVAKLDAAMASRFVFCTGGVLCPQTQSFVNRIVNPVLLKPISSQLLGAMLARSGLR